MLSDLKYALLRLAKTPGFTAIAVLILALGIASNTAVFTVIDTLLLRGLPVPHPEELVLVSKKGWSATGNAAADRYGYGVFEEFRDQAKSVAAVVALRTSNHSLIASGFGRSEIVPIAACGVSGNFFPFLGVSAFLGRTLTLGDDRPDAPQPAVVLSYAFWKRQFGADPAVLGKTLLLDKVQVTIVGVAARGFSGVEVGSPVDLWMPVHLYAPLSSVTDLHFQEPRLSVENFVRMIVRLRPGVKRESAEAELDAIFQTRFTTIGLAKQGNQGGKVDLQPGGSGFIPGKEPMTALLDILMIVVGMVLVVACANVASLLLARTAVRQRELALRTALGAGRGRLIRQLMMEGLLLAAAGGLGGLLFAHWGTAILAGYLPLGASLNLSPNFRILAFTAGISVATGILAGLIPALRFSRLDLISALKDQAATLAGGSGQRLNKTLVAVQIALSVCLLAGAGLFVRTLENLRNVDLGINRTNLLTAYISFDRGDDVTRRVTLSRDLLTALEGLPGVSSVSYTWGGAGLLTGAGPGTISPMIFSVDGHIPDQNELPPGIYAAYVGPRFFETMGIPLLRGRGIEAADVFPIGSNPTGSRPTLSAVPANLGGVVINEFMARKYFGDGDPVGHQIRLGDPQASRAYGGNGIIPPLKIIGVAGNTREVDLRSDQQFEIYLPSSNLTAPPFGTIFALRTSGDPDQLVSAIRSTIHRLDPKLHFPFFTTIDDSIKRSLFQEQMIAQTAGCFSGFALLLASLGLYGVLAYNVTQRTREIGVRMALGARTGNIISLILRQGMGLTAIGCAAGVATAMAVAHLIASRLYGIPALDPLTFIFAVVVLISVALLACWLPARRATKVDPIVALRSE